MQREEALEALITAEDIDEKSRRGGRWYAVFAMIYAAMAFAMALTVGLLPTQLAMGVTMPAWGVALFLLIVYAVRQSATPRRFLLLHGIAIGGWAVAWMITVFVGTRIFPEDPVWWVPAAVVCALPPLVSALMTVAPPRRPRTAREAAE